jgi:hypothetical protein
MKPAVLCCLLAACVGSPPPSPPDPCLIARIAPGPESARITTLTDPLEVARARISEARLTGDPGFYELARQAVTCARGQDADPIETDWMEAHLLLQLHHFAEAEALALTLVERRGGWQDQMLLSDARMEQGRLQPAADALQLALDAHPSLVVYDRAAWLAWLHGQTDHALYLQRQAVSLGSESDPEPLAWSLTQLGWWEALQGGEAKALDTALQLVPGYRPALLARGRVRLHGGDLEGARADLLAAGETVAAKVALAEIDPSTDVRAVGAQDARGYAIWLATRDPAAAVTLLEQELASRQDAFTLLAHAFAVHHAGGDARSEAEQALNTGIPEPEALAMAAVVLSRPDLMERARAAGPGLLPSWRGWSP